jgi:hypothetical protein
MAITSIDICARALVLIGASPITSFDDGTTEAIVADNLYEDTVRDLLSRYRWRFATSQIQMNRLVDAPEHKWDAAYQLPPECILVHGVYIGGTPIEFDRYQDMIYCNAVDTDEVFIDYMFRADEALWPPFFVMTVILQMASVFAYSVAQQEALADLFEKRALRQFTIARNLDSQSQTNRRLPTSRFLDVRRNLRM